MTLDEAIKVLRQHNVKGASVSRITRGQALEKDLLAQVLDSCEQLISEKTEYKRLLKAAVEDFKWLEQHTEDDYGSCMVKTGNLSCGNCPFNTNGADCKWKHEAEALKLIGGSENGT